MRNRREANQWIQNVALAMLAVLVLSGATYALTRRSTSSATVLSPVVTASPTPDAVRPAFLGDSYTGGSGMGGYGVHGWPALVTHHFGWATGLVDGVGGSGYQSGGSAGKPYGVRVDALIAYHPDILIVEGGNNDRQLPLAQTIAEIHAVLTRLRTGLPSAKIVVVGPIAVDPVIPQNDYLIRDAVRREASGINAPFVDPIALGWLRNSSRHFIGRDGVHPTDAGHAWLATQIEQRLRVLHVV